MSSDTGGLQKLTVDDVMVAPWGMILSHTSVLPRGSVLSAVPATATFLLLFWTSNNEVYS